MGFSLAGKSGLCVVRDCAGSIAGRLPKGKGQTVIELLLLLAVSMIALGIIYSLYSQQVGGASLSQERAEAKSTIESMVSSANSLSLSGAGSRARVLVVLPDSLQMDDANIIGGTLLLRLSDGTDLSGSADVNFLGNWKTQDGRFVSGSYYVNMVFDGNVVGLFYDDYDLSARSVSIQAKPGTIAQESFSIRNNSPNSAQFWIKGSYSHAPFSSLSIDPSFSSFTLAPNEAKLVDFNISLGDSAYGSYAGSIGITGRINDGASSTDINKQVVVSADTFFSEKELMIFPSTVSVTAAPGSVNRQSFSLCNPTNASAGVSWARDSNSDASMLGWFGFPPVNSSGQQITSVPASVCTGFDLDISVPEDANKGTYDSNFTASYADGNSFTAYIYVNVAE